MALDEWREIAVDEEHNLHVLQMREKARLIIIFSAALCTSADSAFQNDRGKPCPATFIDALVLTGPRAQLGESHA